jgi:hypothetical protein
MNGNRQNVHKMTILSSVGLSGSSCPPHLWVRLPDSDTVADRIKTLEADSGIGAQYNACLARKFQGQGKHVDVSARFKCRNCDAYQEVDLIVDSELGESKAGNQSARKKQTLNYVEISRELFKNTPVTIYYQNHSRAIRDTPHVANWGAHARYEPCP